MKNSNVINTSATVSTSLDFVANIPVEDRETLGIEVTVTTAALDQFAILGKLSDAGTYQTLFSTSADFTSPTGLLVGTSGDLTAQAVGTGWFIMDCDGLSSVQIKAASGTTTSGIAIKGSAK